MISLLRLILILIFVVPPTTVYGDEFGRLFTSEAERRQLDALRANEKNRPSTDVFALPELVEARLNQAPPMDIKFSGYLQRANGDYMIWINGESALSGSTMPIESAHFETNSDNVTLSTKRYKATLKPGQVWSLKDNSIYEGYDVIPTPQ